MKKKNIEQFSVIKALFISVSFLVLSACGGGGGANDTGESSAAQKVDFSTKSDAELTSLSGEAYSSGGAVTAFDLSSLTFASSGSPKAFQLGTQKIIPGFCSNEAEGGLADVNNTTTEFSIIFTNCSLGDLLLDGSMLVKESGIANFTTEAIFNSFSFHELSSDIKITFDGRLYYALSDPQVGQVSSQGGALTMSIASPELTDTIVVSNFESSYTMDISTGILSTDYSYNVSSSSLGGEITIKTITTIKHLDLLEAYPYTGSFEIRGEGNASILVTIIDRDSVRVQIDKDGDSIYESDKIVQWSDFAL